MNSLSQIFSFHLLQMSLLIWMFTRNSSQLEHYKSSYLWIDFIFCTPQELVTSYDPYWFRQKHYLTLRPRWISHSAWTTWISFCNLIHTGSISSYSGLDCIVCMILQIWAPFEMSTVVWTETSWLDHRGFDLSLRLLLTLNYNLF
jgi:hypothetical protein